MYIGQNIRFLRKKLRFNQTELGERAGVSKGAISSYESGSSIPGIDTLAKIAKIFEVAVDDILFRNIEKEGTSDLPAPKTDTIDDDNVMRINKLMEQRIIVLEREIRRTNPNLADELGID